MSYRSIKSNNYYRTVYLSTNTDFGSNYAVITGGTWSNGVNTGGTISAGFPLDNTVESWNGITWDTTNKYLLIPVRGLYYISCSWNITNNSNTTSDNPIFIGFTVTSGTTHTPYQKVANPENFGTNVKESFSISQMIEFQANDQVRASINDVGTTMTVIGPTSGTANPRGATFISVALVIPFSG